jgi:hypothetical protein
MQNVLQATRRAFLAKAPFAAAAIAAPSVGIAATETAREKVDRLSKELSHALADFDNGDWHARVFAANQPYGGCQLRLDNLRETQEEKVQRMVRMLQFEMMKLPALSETKNTVHDVKFDGDKYLRLSRCANADSDIFVGFVPKLRSPVINPREV